MILKIKKTQLSEEVYLRIKESLFSGEYKEGSLIPSENQLANLLCVSRVVVSYNAFIQEQSMGIHYNVGKSVLDYVKK